MTKPDFPAVRMGNEHRHKIRIGNIINQLQDIAEGKRRGSQVQVNAALGLLRKALPDLQATLIAGSEEQPITLRTIITGVKRAGE